MPPVAESTSGVKDPCSTSMILCSYATLLILVPPVIHSLYGGFAVAWCKRVEHPCIGKCTLLLIPPEALGADICPSIIFCVCSLVLQLLTSEWLKDWLYGDTGTDLCKDVRRDVPDVVVLHRRKPTTMELKACSTLNFFPKVPWEGKYGSGHPYRRLMASLKAPLCRVKPCSVSGNTARTPKTI